MKPTLEKVLFHAVCSLDNEEERKLLLDAACADEDELRSTIESYYEAQSDAADFFDKKPSLPLQTTNTSERASQFLGTRIGRYNLIQRIGEGGCGIVYLAEQCEPVRRQVALKIIRLGMDTENVIARFNAERQTLTMIDHPNIVRVFDAGATDSGRPYFVMEFVDGERITDFCRNNNVEIRQRLELFIQVCRAIHNAHQRGIIHRDIKPSNILVSLRDGVTVPKVIDFGIAKATAVDVSSGATLTRFGQVVGTPAYMPPEIAAGKADIDTRCDIHSLGVLLYELLTGNPPLSPGLLSQLGAEEARRRLIEEDAPRPSTSIGELSQGELDSLTGAGLEKDKLIHLLKGDLDWITLKAMSRDRHQRYESAYGLARDVERYLKDESVIARPPDTLYNLSKLIRRNRISFLSICFAVIALVCGFSASTVLFIREKAARTEQERLREEADSARANEVRLRVSAEEREKLAQAAVQINYNKFETASELLDSVPYERVPASLEVAQSYSAVGMWHVGEARWEDATRCFAAMIRALTEVDPYASSTTSLNFIPAAALLCQSGDAERYEAIRDLSIERFIDTQNPIIAEQVVKIACLMPASSETLSRIKPMLTFLENTIIEQRSSQTKNYESYSWANFSIALAKYRSSEYTEAYTYAQLAFDTSKNNKARLVSAQCILAMIAQSQGDAESATEYIQLAQPLLEETFERELEVRSSNAYWFDWVIARIFYNEALHRN